MKRNTLSAFIAHLIKSSLLTFLLVISACSVVERKPEISSSTAVNPIGVSASTTSSSDVSVGKKEPKLSVAAKKNDSTKIMNALLRSEEKPLTQKDVGYYMDLLYANLRQKLNSDVATISREENNIQIIFPGSLAFETNSSEVNVSAAESLSLMADALSEYHKTMVEVEGHSDNQGDSDYNQQLSERRALAVGQYFTGSGVAISRLFVIGYGSSQPISSNRTVEGRANNRRVKLILKPVVSASTSL